MNFISKFALIAGIAAHAAPACMNPADQWAAGVAFSNGEAINFAAIERLGQSGVDFAKTGAGDSIQYTFRSHYAPGAAMVYLGYFRISYQPDRTVPRIAVVFDTTLDAGQFDFAQAVGRELDWLDDPAVGVLQLTAQDKQRAVDSLHAWGHGDGQYWTKQHTVLAYNSWYTGDTTQGGVYGTNGVRGGCGLDVAYAPVQDTIYIPGPFFTIDGAGNGFAVKDIVHHTLDTVAAVKELGGMFYLPIMSRLPDFWGKVVTGYIEKDSVPYVGANVDVFVETGIVGERLVGVAHSAASWSRANTARLSRTVFCNSRPGDDAFDIRGCRIRPGQNRARIMIRLISEHQR